MLKIAVENKIILKETVSKLGEYLAFGHFFGHEYALDLYAEKLEPLVENMKDVYSAFKKDISGIIKE